MKNLEVAKTISEENEISILDRLKFQEVNYNNEKGWKIVLVTADKKNSNQAEKIKLAKEDSQTGDRIDEIILTEHKEIKEFIKNNRYY